MNKKYGLRRYLRDSLRDTWVLSLLLAGLLRGADPRAEGDRRKGDPLRGDTVQPAG